jgi:hypothetical protein
MAGLANAKEPGRQTGIAEVQLRGLDETLGCVGKPRSHQENQVACLKNGKPRVMRRPVKVPDLHATICHALGIDLNKEVITAQG